MNNPTEILKEFFGYEEFRELQLEIIQSVLDGKDTLALLPTGGGKSVCFQVPALMQDGICIVVTPLIALMKDQVFQLKKRNIKAAAIFSGLSYSEMDMILDNCQFGYYKFLYVSPERLKTDLFIERFKLMNVNLIAVDEAHCVSQWGYDFRPPYLEIAAIRKYHQNVPLIALTATATPIVQKDIVEKLELNNCNIFKKSFLRNNLRFIVRNEDAKYPKLLEIIQKLNGSGIVYVRSRSRTKDIAEYLFQQKINADFYHAGLNADIRNKKQEDWINNKTQVIVCTNAFGMGIDKANVRFVIHVDVPESLEAYYQEAGRAGRDGKLAYAVLLYEQADIDKLIKKIEEKFPPVEIIKRVYNAVCNHLGVAIESGRMMTYNFDLAYFARQFKIENSVVFHCLKILEQENYLQLSEGVSLPSRIIFKVDNLTLYKFEVANANFSLLIKSLLRTYGGIMNHYVKISEALLAKQLKINVGEVVNQLNYLHKHKILTYIPANDQPTITLLTERLHEQNLFINTKNINNRKKTIEEQVYAMIDYIQQNEICRQANICNYFGDNAVKQCGKCDICIEEKKKLQSTVDFNNAKLDILQKTKNNWIKSDELLPQNAHYTNKVYKEVIRFLLDEKVLQINDKNEIKSV